MKLLIILLLLTIYWPSSLAQPNGTKVYTKENPLVYEDSWNLWPYSYLNEDGEPEGFCIDLVKIIMRELNIPYRIELKQHQQALKDLKEGKADLTLGLYDVYGVKFGNSGKNCVAILTQSAVTPRSKRAAIKTFSDLKNQDVIVKDSGLCHQLMVDYDWGNRAKPTLDIGKDIVEMNSSQQGAIVWNTLSLKWLIEHNKLDNVTLTPVNMPYGERKFMSNDKQLLDKVDQLFSELCTTNKIKSLEEKWYYPDRKKPNNSNLWIWFLAGMALILLVATIAYFMHELKLNRKATTSYHSLAAQLARLSHYNKVRFWVYNVANKKFEWHDENGLAINSYTIEEFSKRYNKKDFKNLKEAIERISSRKKDSTGNESDEETLELNARDAEFGDKELHGFVVHLSVLSRNTEGKPTVIIGTKKDVTKEQHLKQVNTEISLRYLSMFYNNESGILLFDKNGRMQNLNPRAAELLQIDADTAAKERLYLNKIFHTLYTNLADTNGAKGTITVGDNKVTYSLKPVFDDYNQLLGLFVFCV